MFLARWTSLALCVYSSSIPPIPAQDIFPRFHQHANPGYIITRAHRSTSATRSSLWCEPARSCLSSGSQVREPIFFFYVSHGACTDLVTDFLAAPPSALSLWAPRVCTCQFWAHGSFRFISPSFNIPSLTHFDRRALFLRTGAASSSFWANDILQALFSPVLLPAGGLIRLLHWLIVHVWNCEFMRRLFLRRVAAYTSGAAIRPFRDLRCPLCSLLRPMLRLQAINLSPLTRTHPSIIATTLVFQRRTFQDNLCSFRVQNRLVARDVFQYLFRRSVV